MARTLRRVGGFVCSAFFLVGLTVLNSGVVRADGTRPTTTRDKADRDAEFSRFVESGLAPGTNEKRVKVETVAATCDPGKVRSARLDEIEKLQRKFLQMHRQRLVNAAERDRAQGGVVSVGEHIARDASTPEMPR